LGARKKVAGVLAVLAAAATFTASAHASSTTTSAPYGTVTEPDGSVVTIAPAGTASGAVAPTAMPNNPQCHYLTATLDPFTASADALDQAGLPPRPADGRPAAAAWGNYAAMYQQGKAWECESDNVTTKPTVSLQAGVARHG
jgi:hypothetical protein